MEVANGAVLLDTLRALLTDAGQHAGLVERGQAMLAGHEGAAGRQAARIRDLVK